MLSIVYNIIYCIYLYTFSYGVINYPGNLLQNNICFVVLYTKRIPN